MSLLDRPIQVTRSWRGIAIGWAMAIIVPAATAYFTAGGPPPHPSSFLLWAVLVPVWVVAAASAILGTHAVCCQLIHGRPWVRWFATAFLVALQIVFVTPAVWLSILYAYFAGGGIV